MTSKMVAVKELIPGNILSDSVLSFNGKILLGKDIVLTPRHISLLISWDIQDVFIKTDEEQPAETVSQEVGDINEEEYQQFFYEYNALYNEMTNAFDIIKRRNRIPIVPLQNTAGNIHSFISDNGATAINYLLANNSRIADFITQHSITVASFAVIIARQLKWSENDILGVTLAGLLHDVGNLVAGETDCITDRTHIIETAAILKKTSALSKEVILGIVQHREYNDGSGVPTGANSATIHPYAKVIAICDAFHNQLFTNEHANPFLAMNMLANNMFSKLDPFMCHTFINRLRDSLLNNKILLSNGQEAEIIYFHPNGSYLPIIRTANNQIIDLSKESIEIIQRVIPPCSPPMLPISQALI